MDSIPLNEVAFVPDSNRDMDGRIFRWKGRIYRGITAANAPMFKRLFRDGTIRRLVDLGLLVETELTAYALDGYELVVRHRSIPFVSYPTEWCAAMFRDAALVTLDLVKELAACGLTLKDSHPWNLLFDGHKPVHVDLTSIRPLGDDGTWPAYDEFCHYFYYPLLLMSHRSGQPARWFMDTDRGVWRRDLLMLAPATAPSLLVDFARSRSSEALIRRRSYNRSDNLKPLFALLKRLRSKVERMPLSVENPRAADLNENGSASARNSRTSAAEQEAFHKVITELKPRSVLNIGSEENSYPTLAAHAGCNVVVFDTQPFYITQLYHFAHMENLPILPLMNDFTKVIPACKLPSYQQNDVPWAWDTLTERFQCDMVLAQRVPQLLDPGQGHLSYAQIVDALTLFSRRWVLVGFVPCQDYVAGAKQPGCSTRDALATFTEVVRQRFHVVNVITLDPGAGALLVCEK